MRSPTSFALLCFLVLQTRAVAVRGAAPDAGMERLAPERLVFLLEYIGSDYGNAVQDGRLADPREYREMTEFSRIVAEQYALAGGSDQTSAELAKLRGLIRDLRPWAEVRASSFELATKVSAELGAAPRLTMAPDLVRGRGLYMQSCAVCHGSVGGGDGRAAPGMDPPPTSFRGPRMNLVRPRQVFAATTFGVDGTAMPSFAEGFTSQQIWDIAFHVMTLREDFDPRPSDGELPLSLEGLASSSNEELLARLRSPRPHTAVSEIDYCRLHPPAPSPEPGPDVEAAVLL